MIVSYCLPLVALLGCVLALGLLLRRAAVLPVDVPNERSLHARPTPRIGGLGMVVGVLVAFLAARGSLGTELALLAGLAFGLAIFSLLDDWRGLSVTTRFSAHMLAAAAALWVLVPASSALWWVVLILAMVWITNLYNFMDGADGLAGGMAMFGFSAYALAALLGGHESLALLAGMLAAAAMGFLAFNFPPARVFMGDAGSIPLGFLAASLGIYGWIDGVWPWTFPLLVFSPFFVDASITLVRRGLRGEKVWQAHREHYYQRLVRMGLSHRKLVLGEYGLMLAVCTSALVMVYWPVFQWPLLAVWSTVYFSLARWLDREWEAHEVV